MNTNRLLRPLHVGIMAFATIASACFMSASVQAAAPMVKTSGPGFYREMLGDFEITALSGRHSRFTGRQDSGQHHAGHGWANACQILFEDSAGNLVQRLFDQYRQQAGAGRHRRRQIFRADARQSACKFEGFRLPTRTGR